APAAAPTEAPADTPRPPTVEPTHAAPKEVPAATPRAAAPRKAKEEDAVSGEELLARAQRALDKGHFTSPRGESAVDLLVEASSSGAPPAALRKVEARVVKALDVKGHHELRRRDYRQAQASFAGILKLRPDDRAASIALRQAEKRLRR